MKINTWLILFIFFPTFLFSGVITYTYSIHYAGLPVARTIITHDDSDSIQTITIEASSRGLVSAFFSIENTYLSSCDPNFLPLHFWKTIHQQNVQEKKVIMFRKNPSEIEVRDIRNEKVDTLRTDVPVYDIVSFSFALINELPEHKTYPCYGNYRLWEMEAQISGSDELYFNKKEYRCNIYKIHSSILYDTKKDSKTDILTNNIFKPNGVTYYWIDPQNHLLIKAKYKRFPFSIFMYLEDIEEH